MSYCNINETSVDVLDRIIFEGYGFSNDNILDTKVYIKETDTHELLHKNLFIQNIRLRGSWNHSLSGS